MFGSQYQNAMQGYGQPSFQNPYLERLQALQQPQMGQPQHYDLITVNGENGARAFRMAPNSRCLLLDETAPIIWLAQTDGAGYPSLTPYSITPYQAQPAQSPLEDRLTRLEAFVYGKPDPTNAQPTAVQPAGDATAVPAVPAADGRKKPAAGGQ